MSKRLASAVMVLVSAVLLGLIVYTTAAAAPGMSTLAKGTVDKIPDGDFIFRVADLTLNATDPGVTHQHNAGMEYAVDGREALVLDGKGNSLDPGQAAWVGEQTPHTHISDGRAESHFLFMVALFPAANKGAAIRPGFRNASVPFESDNLTLPNRGPQDVILTDNSYAAGEDSGTQTYGGPTLLATRSGKFTVNIGNASRSMQTGDYALAQGGAIVQIRADANQGGHILAMTIVPQGQPALLPQASVIFANPGWLIGLAIAAVAVLAVGWIFLRRNPRKAQ
jgi:quercetin dioxygenase-like cupin family protein